MSDRPAPHDYYEECPECGTEDLKTWVEKVEYGGPTNWRHKPVAEAPRYRTKPVRFFVCTNDECGWGRP